MASKDFGGTEADFLLNAVTELNIDDGTDDSTFVDIHNVAVSENIPTHRVDVRQKRVYTQSDPDLDVSFTVYGSVDAVTELYDSLGSAREASGALVYPSRLYTFTGKDTNSTQGEISLSGNGILMSRRTDAAPSNVAGTHMCQVQVRILDKKFTVA